MSCYNNALIENKYLITIGGIYKLTGLFKKDLDCLLEFHPNHQYEMKLGCGSLEITDVDINKTVPLFVKDVCMFSLALSHFIYDNKEHILIGEDE